MIIPDNLIKELLELLDDNDGFLAAYEDQVRESGVLVYSQDEIREHKNEIREHKNKIWDLKHKIEENAQNEN